MQFIAPQALLSDGWKTDVLIDVDEHGIISGIESAPAHIGSVRRLPGPVLPGMPNLHSHAFQRAMAGLTERRGQTEDSFWTWRDTMYDFVSRISSQDIGDITAQVYVEMLEAGYTSVGEFHYLHHDPDGHPYPDLTETSAQIIDAGRLTGIFLTHLPVLYGQGGFGGAPLSPHQRRFGNDAARFCSLLDELHSRFSGQPQTRMGMAIHSLRAVSPDTMHAAIAHLDSLDSEAPVHIHIAEQAKEVEECLAWSGQRPVEWLFANLSVNDRWCLVHATHVNEGELDHLARSGAVVGLCPTTEANLGDGIFPASALLRRGGRFGVGSDSNVSVSVAEELKLLEYSQRLRDQRRAILAPPEGGAVGQSIYLSACRGGAQALGIHAGSVVVGKRADLVVLDPEAPQLCGMHGDEVIDSAIFACGNLPVKEVMIGGRTVVSDGRHHARDAILARYAKTIGRLRKRR